MGRWAKAALEASKGEATDKAQMLALLEKWRDEVDRQWALEWDDRTGLVDCHDDFNELTALIVDLEESKDLRGFLSQTSGIYCLPYPIHTWGDWWYVNWAKWVVNVAIGAFLVFGLIYKGWVEGVDP